MDRTFLVYLSLAFQETAGGALTDEEFFRNLTITHTVCDQLETQAFWCRGRKANYGKLELAGIAVLLLLGTTYSIHPIIISS